MAKFVSDLILDNGNDYLKANGTEMYVCSSEPVDRAAAITAALATKTGLTTGDFTLADGDSPGRKVTVSAQSSLNVDSDGTATHVAICSATQLLIVTTMTSQALTSGNTVNIPSFKREIADVTP